MYSEYKLKNLEEQNKTIKKNGVLDGKYTLMHTEM